MSAPRKFSNFTISPSLQAYNIPSKAWLAKSNESTKIDGIASAVAVFNPSTRVLLIQRAAHDSLPNKWELPGGAVDLEDETILHGAARELFEEAGLKAKHFSSLVTEGEGSSAGTLFGISRGTRTICRFAFAAEVEDWECVKLDPNEHQAYMWATEEEIRSERNGEKELPITKESVKRVILEAFRLRREKFGPE